MLAVTRRPSASTPGQGGEAGIDQHELGDRLGCRRAGAHGDAHVGLLEGEDVVDPVAGHGHRVAAALQGLHHGRLLVGVHPAEDGGGVHDLGQFLAALGQVRASTARSAPSTPALAAMVATVAGLSPEMTLICTPCLRK